MRHTEDTYTNGGRGIAWVVHVATMGATFPMAIPVAVKCSVHRTGIAEVLTASTP